ncbi:MAG: phospholipase D-like domain-containing protein [Spirochaetia bacterium]|nr:phospholipase D-like domain-containing protein [Spirochaetia bacterium]
MSCLSEESWKLIYDSDDGPLGSRFYTPALKCAVRYDRTTGYFTAGALTIASQGIEHLVISDGRMRLIVGCTLEQDEIYAVQRGEELSKAIATQTSNEFEEVTDPTQLDALELLSWMVARGYLEIRVAIPCTSDRMPVRDNSIFHEKTGIIEDSEGNRLAFNGSVNETFQGWTYNFESFTVHYSWRSGHEEYIDDYESIFAKKWRGEANKLITIDIPSALRERLLRYLPEEGKYPRRLEYVDFQEDSRTTAKNKPLEYSVQSKTDCVELYTCISTVSGEWIQSCRGDGSGYTLASSDTCLRPYAQAHSYPTSYRR